jgi:hypothetical protein
MIVAGILGRGLWLFPNEFEDLSWNIRDLNDGDKRFRVRNLLKL